MQLFMDVNQESLKIRTEKEANFLHISELSLFFSQHPRKVTPNSGSLLSTREFNVGTNSHLCLSFLKNWIQHCSFLQLVLLRWYKKRKNVTNFAASEEKDGSMAQSRIYQEKGEKRTSF